MAGGAGMHGAFGLRMSQRRVLQQRLRLPVGWRIQRLTDICISRECLHGCSCCDSSMGENVVSPLGSGHAYRAPGQGGQFSETPCFTCRRRRVICDKVLPTCRKCHAAGKQCLGYKKPLTWVRGVASRGKMMGLTFEDVAPKKPKGESRAGIGTSRVSVLGSSEERRGGAPPSRSLALVRRPSGPSWAPSRTPSWLSDVAQTDGDQNILISSGLVPSTEQLNIPPSLVDPVLQGLDQLERYYLSHCA